VNLNCKILHVEDNDDDSFIFQRVLARLLFTGAYRRVGSVDAAIDYLSGNREFADRRLFPLPDVVVLDTSLPGAKETSELMSWMQERPEFSPLMKVVLTGGMSMGTQQSWLERGAAGILMKGLSVADMALSVENILMRCA
jgi:CheY-like chemotaxis protein